MHGCVGSYAKSVCAVLVWCHESHKREAFEYKDEEWEVESVSKTRKYPLRDS